MVVKKRNNSVQKILVNKKEVNSNTRSKRSTGSKSKSQRSGYSYDGRTKSVDALRKCRGAHKQKLLKQLIEAVSKRDTNALRTIKKMKEHGMISNTMWTKTFGRKLLNTMTTVLSNRLNLNAQFIYLRFMVDYYSTDKALNKKFLRAILNNVAQMLSTKKTYPRTLYLILDMEAKGYPLKNCVFESIMYECCSLWNKLSLKIKLGSLKALEQCMYRRIDKPDPILFGYTFTGIILRELKKPINNQTHRLHDAVLGLVRYICEDMVVSNFVAPAINTYLNRCERTDLLITALQVPRFGMYSFSDSASIYASNSEYCRTFLRLCYHENRRVAKNSCELVLELCEFIPRFPNICVHLKHGLLEVFRLYWTFEPGDSYFRLELLLNLAEGNEDLHVHMRAHKLDFLVAEMIETHWNDDPEQVADGLRFLELIEYKEDVGYEVTFPLTMY